MSKRVIVSCLVSTWITFWQVDASHRDTRWPVVRYKLFRCFVARRVTVRCVASRCLCAKLMIATCLVLAKCLFIRFFFTRPLATSCLVTRHVSWRQHIFWRMAALVARPMVVA